MTELPDGWVMSTLGSVADWSSGGTPKSGTPAYYGGEIPWAVIGDLKDSVVNSTATSITDDGLRNSSAKVVASGTVLVAMYGSIGKLGVAGVPMATNQAIACAVPTEAVTREWLFMWLRSQRPQLLAAGKGGTQANISQTILKSWPIPIAPLNEQRRIVVAIEEALSRLEAGEAALRTVRRLTDRMKDAVLASSLQVRPRSGSQVGRQSGEAGNQLPRLPPHWTWAELGDIAQVAGGVTKDSKRQDDPDLVEVPYLRVANVQRGFLDLSSVTTIRVDAEKARRLELRYGDVLFNEGGDRDKLGRGWVWRAEIPRCIHQNHVFRARLDERMAPEFVSWWGNTFGRRWFEQHGKQSTNLASINLSTLKSFPVPMPPRAEQDAIVRDVEQQLSFIAACERSVESALVRIAALRRSVLQTAFEGRLVPQDPADEPAERLLASIRLEHSGSAPNHIRRAGHKR